MSKSNVFIQFFSLFLAIITSLACSTFSLVSATPTPSAPKLPNYGVFLVNGASYTELQQLAGQPDKQSLGTNLQSTSSNPVFLVWYPQINLQYFLLVALDHLGTGIPVKITPNAANNQILEIKPTNPLPDDVYCFYQGDPLGNPYALPFWCFQVSNSAANSLPGQASAPEIANVPTVLPQSGLDKQATKFRDKALKVVRGLDTVQYTFTKTEPAVPGVSPVKYWSGTATQVSVDEKQFADDERQIGEMIVVENMRCDRFGDLNASWNCQPSTNITLFSQISNILAGKPRFPGSDFQIMAFSSSQKSYGNKQCRSFDVQYKAIYGEYINVELDEVCFDLETYYPLFMGTYNTSVHNGEISDKSGYETTELKINVPIDDIVLPQH